MRNSLMVFRYRGLVPDEVRVKEHTAKLEMKLDGYEAILSKQKYLAGEVRATSCEIRPAVD